MVAFFNHLFAYLIVVVPLSKTKVQELYNEAEEKMPDGSKPDWQGYHSDLKHQINDVYGHLSSEPPPVARDHGKENNSPERKEEMLRAKFRVFMRWFFFQPACFGAGCYIEMATSYH